MNTSNPYYRYEALNYIVKLDGANQRNLLIHVFQTDSDLRNRDRALILIADEFYGQKDKEILKLALSVYDDPNSSIESRLTAGAAMMFQLGIPSDESGRPAFWEQDEEELLHPLIQMAVSQTRKILTYASKN